MRWTPLLLVVALAAPAAGQAAHEVAGPLGKTLDRAVQTTSGGGFWGAVLVARKGRVLLAKGYGYADYQGQPNTPGTLFEVASVSKQFTGAAILKLAQQRKLRLQDPLSRFFPGLPKDKQPITVRELLTHTAGLDPEVGIAYGSPLGRDAAVKRLLRDPLGSRRGARFAYSNAGYAILAAIVEKASGEAFEAYLRRELFQAAGMTETGFVSSPWLDKARASTRLSEELPGTAVEWFWSWGYRGMGGVVTTVRDLLKWHQALNRTTVLDAARKKLLFSPAKRGYACGWFVEVSARGTPRHSHSGGVAGYAANLVRLPQEDVVIAVLSNGKSDLMAVTRALEETLYPPPKLRLTLELTDRALGKWKAIELPGSTWTAARAGAEVRLSLADAKGRPAARLVLPHGVARKLWSDLRRAYRQRPAAKPKATAAADTGFYLRPYALDGKRQLELDRKLGLRVLPRYVGQDEAGKRVVDERVVLVVTDGAFQQWPVMSRLDQGAAKALVDALGAAVHGRKK